MAELAIIFSYLRIVCYTILTFIFGLNIGRSIKKKYLFINVGMAFFFGGQATFLVNGVITNEDLTSPRSFLTTPVLIVATIATMYGAYLDYKEIKNG